jgi:hypothetical protein
MIQDRGDEAFAYPRLDEFAKVQALGEERVRRM